MNPCITCRFLSLKDSTVSENGILFKKKVEFCSWKCLPISEINTPISGICTHYVSDEKKVSR